MKEQVWVGALMGGLLGLVAAVGLFLLRNWLYHYVAIPLAILGWLMAAVIVYGIATMYLTTPKHTQDSPNVSYMATVFVTGIIVLLGLLAVYHWWQNVGGGNGFAYLVVEAVFAAVVGYGFNQATQPLADVLCDDTNDILDTDDVSQALASEMLEIKGVLQSFDWVRELSYRFSIALTFGLICLEIARPFLALGMRGS